MPLTSRKASSFCVADKSEALDFISTSYMNRVSCAFEIALNNRQTSSIVIFFIIKIVAVGLNKMGMVKDACIYFADRQIYRGEFDIHYIISNFAI